jgi:glycosyltransferase involved in cell wall biosynthesis
MEVIKYKLLRVTTVPMSLSVLLKGQFGFFKKHGFDVYCVSSESPDLYAVGERECVSVKSVNMTRRISPIQDVISLWRMYHLIKEIKPHIVHSHTPKAGVVSMVAAWLAGVRIRLHTVAGLPLVEASGLKRLLLEAVERLTYSCATKVYPNSFGLQDFLVRKHLVSRVKTKVIGNGSSNGINTTFFSINNVSAISIENARNELGISVSDFVFIFVGRLVTDKGINELVEAFLRVCDTTKCHRGGNYKLLMVGSFETDLDPLFKETLFRIKNTDSIIVAGYKSDVRPYFALSDCLVFPSYREGFPNVVLQAGALGLASIVSDINGCNEIITDGITGLVVPPKNVSLLVSAMLKISTDHDLRYHFGLAARQIITERYEQDVFWNLQKNEYMHLLKSQENN